MLFDGSVALSLRLRGCPDGGITSLGPEMLLFDPGVEAPLADRGRTSGAGGGLYDSARGRGAAAGGVAAVMDPGRKAPETADDAGNI